MAPEPPWLAWAMRLQAIAQTGLTYSEDAFDDERYAEVRDIAAEMMATGTKAGIGDILEIFGREQGYATPKVDVRGVVFREDAILLVRERGDGLWALPGGWADVGESPSENVVKEIHEESGYETKALKLLAFYDKRKHGHSLDNPFHAYKAFFLCELLGGKPTLSVETSAVGFFSRHELPELSTGRVTESQLVRFFEHRHHPDWPTDFD